VDIQPLVIASAAASSLGNEALANYLTLTRDAQVTLAAAATPIPDDVMALDQLAVAANRLEAEQERRRNRDTITASSGGRAGAMARARGRARPSPESAPRASGAALVAGVGGVGVPAGSPLDSRAQLAELTAECLERMALTLERPRREVVARADWRNAYSDDRRLGPTPQRNTERIDAICAPPAIVASGGVCLPVNVDYSVPTWVGATRPLRDALPAFQADRGGLRFVSPPDVGVPSLQSTPSSGLASATTVWTEATDASPAGATKPVYTVQCGSEQLVYVNAIATRLQFGNMEGRFAPEQIAANTTVAVSVAAREAELELLTLMYGYTKQVETSQYLGATRDLLAAADILVSRYRYVHRIPRTAPLTAVFPAWAIDVIRADMVREIGHDNAGSQNVLAITDAQIEEWFAARTVKIIWTLDGVKAGTYGTGGTAITSQFFGDVTTTDAVVQWPGQTSTGAFKLAWLLYAEGSYQFLDGGRLTLGVVRDSTLDATNDYECFVETFEGVAFRGIQAYQVISTIAPSGGTAGTVASGLASAYHE
jgi:hypothetical protein